MLDGEEKLIQDAIRGKASAFGSLYDYYQPKIYRFVLVKVGRREEAEDLTHQVFLNAWTNVKGYEDLGFPFSSWLYRIARNLVVDFYRTRRNEASLEKIDPEYFVVQASTQFDVADKMEMEKVRSAIARLKPEYQDVVMMRFVEDLPIKEVAEALDKTEGAVKLIQYRAIKELKTLLGVKES
ncbi:MAG: sigma-70 family RNA polymerase sigma factor [Candidatus Liptonbacteria bacterium]|nr:sigma-70 family RNA polymerase sigma factor [Candidatus Liptonbacteria bacterium]